MSALRKNGVRQNDDYAGDINFYQYMFHAVCGAYYIKSLHCLFQYYHAKLLFAFLENLLSLYIILSTFHSFPSSLFVYCHVSPFSFSYLFTCMLNHILSFLICVILQYVYMFTSLYLCMYVFIYYRFYKLPMHYFFPPKYYMLLL